MRTFNFEGTWEGDAISSRTSAVENEVVGLSSTGGFVR